VANIRYKTYQDYLNSMGGLINWPTYTVLSATQQTSLQQFYNNKAGDGWIASNWLAVCPNGEARFVGNQGFYPNNLAVTTYWTATALTVTGNSIANPADGRVTASRLLETAANSEHKDLQTTTFIPGATYQLTCYYRPIGGRYLYLTANDGVNNYYSTFSPSGTVAASSSTVSQPSTVNQTANGFWVCSIYFTAAATAGSGTFGPGISTDGTVVSYAGDTSKGIYSWGNVLSQTTYTSPTALLIPNDQLGEDFIDSVFQVYQMSPVGPGYPVPQSFQMMPDGVQIIGATSGWVWNGWLWSFPSWFTAGYPVFLYYRKGCPSYSGTAFSTTATYTVDSQILYNDATNGYDFWKCIVATSANESPASAPTKWEELKLPEFLFQYVLYGAFADFLRMDAQQEKAEATDALAQEELIRQHDREERQMGIQPAFRVGTHQTFRASGWPTF
jgi:hypothetical protein